MIKKENFGKDMQELAEFAKAVSHPARLAIIKYLAETKSCISGDISGHIPLSRTTVSQHLKELKRMGMIHGEIDGLRINYCICTEKVNQLLDRFNDFFKEVKEAEIGCCNHS